MGFSSSQIQKNEAKKENKKTIFGILCTKYTNEIIYEGDLINGKCDGNGKYVFKTGDFYIGQFKNGLREGKGTQYYKNEKIQYKGNWKNDMRNGSGKYYYENGDYFIGFWKDNIKIGKGELFNENGVTLFGGDIIYINTEEKNYSIDLTDLTCLIIK